MGILKRRVKDEDLVINLRANDLVRSDLAWGLPTRCPRCDGYGYLDRIDVIEEVMYQHCPRCWARWETHHSELLAGT